MKFVLSSPRTEKSSSRRDAGVKGAQINRKKISAAAQLFIARRRRRPHKFTWTSSESKLPDLLDSVISWMDKTDMEKEEQGGIGIGPSGEANTDPKPGDTDDSEPSTSTKDEKTGDQAVQNDEVKNNILKDIFRRTACVNCDERFRNSNDQVTEIKVGYYDETEDGDETVPNSSIISIVKALYSVLSADSNAIDGIDLSEIGLCLKCAEVASQLYRHYVDLVNLSTATSPLSQYVQQFKNWHLQHPSPLNTSSIFSNGVIELVPSDDSLTAVVDVPKNPTDNGREEDQDEEGDDDEEDHEEEKEGSDTDTEEISGQVTSKDGDFITEPEVNSETKGQGEVEELAFSGLRKSTRERKAKQKFDPHADVVETPPPITAVVGKGSGSRNSGRSSEKRMKLEETPKMIPATSASENKTRKSVRLPTRPNAKQEDKASKASPSKAKATTSVTKPKPSAQAVQSSRSSSKSKERTTINSISSRN